MRILIVTRYRGGGRNLCSKYAERGYEVKELVLPNISKKRFISKAEVILREVRDVFKILGSLNKVRNSKVYATGGQYACMLTFRTLGWMLSDAHLYIHNFYIHSLGKNTKSCVMA